MTPRTFRPTCYAQLSHLRPAPAQPKRRMSAVNLAFALALLVLAAPAVYLLLTGDFPGSSLFYGLQEDSPIVTALLSVALHLR